MRYAHGVVYHSPVYTPFVHIIFCFLPMGFLFCFCCLFFFFFNDTATTEIYTLSLHDALPILAYMGLTAGTPIKEISLDKIFIGSCTNSRIEDLRAAAKIAEGKKVADNIKLAMVVPGSGLVKQQADRKSTRLNSSHTDISRMPSSA